MKKKNSIPNKLKGWLLPIILGAFICFLLIALPKTTDVWLFLTFNSVGFILFFSALIICSIISFANYYKTLGPFEEETEETGVTAKRNKKLWLYFWILWNIYFSLSAVLYEKLNSKIFICSSILCIIPSLLSYSFAWQVRRDEIKQEEEEKKRLGTKYQEQEPYNRFINEKYQNGYYALICIPIFFVLSGIGLAIKHFL